MSTAADSVRAWLQAQPVLTGWRLQFGRWVDDGPGSRYAVLRPVGGLPAALVREPRFTLLLVGQSDAATAAYDAAAALVEASRSYSGPLVSLEAGEPVASATADGRPTAEIAVSTITN